MHPTFLRLGDFVIYWYGVLVAAAVLVCSLIFQKNAAMRGYSSQMISKILLWVVVWGIIGGRLLHVIVQMPYYYRNPFQILMIRNGGLAAEGSVIAVIIFLAIYSKIRNFKLPEMFDIVALPVPLGQAMGRLGCFLNGCCYGKPTESFLGVEFPFLSESVHPVQLYYSVVYVGLFFLLKTLYNRKLKPGIVFGAYILGFALIRYFVDILRGDMVLTSWNLYPTQVVGTMLFATGAVWLFCIFRRPEVH